MINCFLQDKSLHNRVTGTYTDADINSGHGYLTDYLKSYFATAKTFTDKRASRLDLGGGVQSSQPMSLHFDGAQDSSGIDFSAIPDADRDAFFNIIEALAYNIVGDAGAYETLFAGSGATFGIYTASSLERSVTNTAKDFFENDVDAAEAISARGWVQFTCTLDGTEETFKVWLASAEFEADYPITTFTHITYPDDPTRLLNGTYTGAAAMADASQYATTDINTTVSTGDNTGVKTFTSIYNPGGISNVLNPSVYFLVFYKGAEPTNQEVRAQIRDDLLGRSLTDENTWKTILPDLFVSGRHFIVPFWDNIEELPGDIDVYRGIVNHQSGQDLLETIFDEYETSFIAANAEILTSSASEMLLMALPSNENDVADLSLVSDYPTYQPIDGTVPFFENQDLATQTFNIKLASAIAVLTGADNNTEFGEDSFEGRNWLTFTANFKEYHVLKSDQFPESY